MINPAHYNKYFIWKKNGIKWSIRIIDHHYCLNCLHELLLAGKIEWSTNRFLISWHVLIFSLWLSLTRLTWDNFFFAITSLNTTIIERTRIVQNLSLLCYFFYYTDFEKELKYDTWQVLESRAVMFDLFCLSGVIGKLLSDLRAHSVYISYSWVFST